MRKRTVRNRYRRRGKSISASTNCFGRKALGNHPGAFFVCAPGRARGAWAPSPVNRRWMWFKLGTDGGARLESGSQFKVILVAGCTGKLLSSERRQLPLPTPHRI